MEYFPPIGQAAVRNNKVSIPYYEDASKRRMQSVLGFQELETHNPRVQLVAKRWETFFRQQETITHEDNKPVEQQPQWRKSAASAGVYLQQLKGLLSRTSSSTSSSSSSFTTAADSTRRLSCCFGTNALLQKLKEELSMATSNFRMDFIQQNGITMLCEALRKLQDEINEWEGASSGDDLEILKNKMVDEFHCIMCIKFAAKDLNGCDEVLHSDNLETVCQSLLSPCMQSRIAVMDFLSNLLRACPTEALRPILQQFTTLRVRYAQPDRFQFLVSMTQSSGKLNLLFKASLLGMTNEMLSACPSGNYQVFLQTELEEAGLKVDEVEKAASSLVQTGEAAEDAVHVVRQAKVWRDNYIMVDKPRRNFAYKIKSTGSDRSTASSLPTYEYGSEYTSSPSPSQPAFLSLPPAPVVPPRNSSSTGEIRVVIKSVSPSSDDSIHHPKAGTSSRRPDPPPMPTSKPPRLEQTPFSSQQHDRHVFSLDLPPPPTSLLPSPASMVKNKKSGPPFGREGRQIQSSGLNQRMADKFSGEFDNWRRKRSGDSVESVGDSSDSADSQGDFNRAVYLVDGISPAQRTMIDDVLLQFDRAYDVLADRDPIEDHHENSRQRQQYL